MSSFNVRFVENETGTEVSVETVFGWHPHPKTSIVTYPNGRKYALTDTELNKHFTIATPQNVRFKAFGVGERPTEKQRELQEESLL